MSLSAISAGPDYLPPSRPSKRVAPRKGFYRFVALVTVFAMMFGGLLLMPMSAAAASAVTTSRLNLRSGPGQEHEVLAVIPDGASISVDGDQEAGYYPVTWNGTSGYALAQFIQIGGSTEEGESDAGGEAPPSTDGAPTGTAWVTVNRLNFRSGPSVDSSVLAVLSRGDAVELTGQQANGFWQANAAGTTGWVSSEYVTTSGAPSAPTTPPPAEESDDSSDGGSVPVGGNVTGNATTTSNLNLRSGPSSAYGVISVIPRGAAIELRGEPQGGYYPVNYNGTTGWAHSDWISVGSSAPAPSPDPEPTPAPGGNGSVPVGDSVTGLATTTANLNMRSGPGMDYAVRTVIPNGTAVELRGDPQNGFHPVNYDGTTGWVHGDWLRPASLGPLPEPDPTPAPAPGGNGSVPVGDTVTGSATTTANLNLRSGPGTDYDVHTVIPNGRTVELRGDAQNGFYPVSFNGTTGWAHGDWLDVGGGPAPSPEPTPTPTPAPGGNGSVPVGDAVTGTASTTDSLNLRRGPGLDYAVVTVIPFGASVELRGEPQNGFHPVSYNGTTGWAHGDWLSTGGGPAPSPDPEPTPTPGPTPTPDPNPGNGNGNGDRPQYLYTESAVNMRSQPTTDSAIVWTIPPQTRVTITGPMQNGWYPTSWAHVSGWMHSDYLVPSIDLSYPPEKQWIVDIIYAAADRYGQPREDMLRVAQCESHLDPSAVNMDHANDNDRASGLFQFRPSTWATTPYADQDIFDAEANANAAAWMWSVGRRNEWACQ